MKKLIAVVLTMVLLATSGIAYAGRLGQQSVSRNNEAKPVRPTVKDQAYDNSNGKRIGQDNKAGAQQLRLEMQERKREIIDNRNEINSLRVEVKNKVRLVREELKKLKAKPSELTEEKTAQIREKLALIRGDKALLGKTQGKLGAEAKQLKWRKQTGNTEGAIGNYNNICTVQEHRIEALKKLSADLDGLLAIL